MASTMIRRQATVDFFGRDTDAIHQFVRARDDGPQRVSQVGPTGPGAMQALQHP